MGEIKSSKKGPRSTKYSCGNKINIYPYITLHSKIILKSIIDIKCKIWDCKTSRRKYRQISLQTRDGRNILEEKCMKHEENNWQIGFHKNKKNGFLKRHH